MCDRAMTTADTILKNKNKANGCKSHRMKGRQKGRHRGVAMFKALILWIQPLPGSSFILLTRGTRKSPLGFLLSVNLYLKTPWNKQEYTDSLLFFPLSSSVVCLFLLMLFDWYFQISEFKYLSKQLTGEGFALTLITSEESLHGHQSPLLLQPWQGRTI